MSGWKKGSSYFVAPAATLKRPSWPVHTCQATCQSKLFLNTLDQFIVNLLDRLIYVSSPILTGSPQQRMAPITAPITAGPLHPLPHPPMRNRGLRPLPFSNSSVGSFMSPSSLLMTQDEGECHATARSYRTLR